MSLYNDLAVDAPDTSDEMECTDECSMLHPDELTDDNTHLFEGWVGRESECDEKEEGYYGSTITVLACPRCGESVREMNDEPTGRYRSEDELAERRQMGLVDF